MSSECDIDTSENGGDVFICSFLGCPKSFRRRDRLKHHVAACHEGENPFRCSYEGCGKNYSNPAGLKRHTNNVHAEKTKTAPTISCTVQNCSATFISEYNLKKHLKRIHENRQLKCSHCAKTFAKRQQMKIHEFQHTGVKPFKCSFEGCEKDFLLPSKLKAHMKYHKGYKCSSDGCDSTFATWSLRQKHMKQNHIIEHRCSICDKLFSNKKNLRNHSAMHSDTRKIFRCPQEGCRSFYYYEVNLKQHIKTKHEGKTYACSHPGCNMEFRQKSTLAKHLKVHDPSTSAKDEPMPKRKCLKRRSTAARLSRYKATRDEEISVMYPELSASRDEEMPKVVVISSDVDHTVTDLELNDESKTEDKSKIYQSDYNVIEQDESLIKITNESDDNNINKIIRGIVCKAAA